MIDSFSDRLDHVVQADPPRLRRTKGRILNVLPIRSPAPNTKHPLERVGVGKSERPLGAVDEECRRVVAGRLEGCEERCGSAVVELQYGNGLSGVLVKNRSPA